MSDSKISNDSGILKNVETLKSTQRRSKARCLRSQHPPPESPVTTRKGVRKKRKLEDGASEEYSKRVSTLQQLWKEEEKLKIAIDLEKLKKEQPLILDTDVLREKIAEYRRLLREARHQHKMKSVMCSNLQMANTLQRIVGKATAKQDSFSESQRKCIEDLLKKKKELNRSISIKRKEIAVADEDILKLQKAVPTHKNTKKKPAGKRVLKGKNATMDSLEELKRLNEDSELVAERVHLLSGIIRSLVPQTDGSDLLELMTECEKVSRCPLDSLDDIKEVLTSVRSVNL